MATQVSFTAGEDIKNGSHLTIVDGIAHISTAKAFTEPVILVSTGKYTKGSKGYCDKISMYG